MRPLLMAEPFGRRRARRHAGQSG